MLAHDSSTVETHRRQKTTSFGRSTLTNCVTVARDETATEPERGSDESRCAAFTELSHVTKQQLGQNARVTKVDVPSLQNCRTAISKSHSHTIININAVAELAETSMKKSASTCTNHCKIQPAINRGSNFMRQNENRCADFTMRGRRRKVQGRPTAETSRKN